MYVFYISSTHYLLVLKVVKIELSAYALEKILQVIDGTFLEEPGSGAVATIDNKKVSVGTLDWITR